MLNNFFTSSGRVFGATCLLAISSLAQAQITAFSDDFQGYGAASTFSPWLGFSDNGGFTGGYSFGPSTSGPQITALADDGAGNDYLNFYANYDNVNVHDRVNCSPCSPNTQEQIFVYRQMSFTGSDTAAGDTWVFSFDYRDADIPPAGATEVAAYIRIFDPVFNILFEAQIDTKSNSNWKQGIIPVKLDPAWVDGVIQIGFTNLVGNYEDSGVFYDNVSFVKAQGAEADMRLGATNGFLHPHHNDVNVSPFLDDVIPVVVFGTSTAVGDPVNMNTDNIISSTVRFGPGIAKNSPNHPPQFNLDINNDGLEDARFRFLMSDSEFQCSDSLGTLSGELTTGETFAGSDAFPTKCNATCH